MLFRNAKQKAVLIIVLKENKSILTLRYYKNLRRMGKKGEGYVDYPTLKALGCSKVSLEIC